VINLTNKNQLKDYILEKYKTSKEAQKLIKKYNEKKIGWGQLRYGLDKCGIYYREVSHLEKMGIIKPWVKEEETLEKYKTNKEVQRIIKKFNEKKMGWPELIDKLRKYYIPIESMLYLKKKGIIKKTSEEIEEEKERARRERLEAKLSPEELKIRRKIKKKSRVPLSWSCFGGRVNIHYGYAYTKEQIKELKKIPIKTVKKVLTPKEFKTFKKEVYRE